MDRYKNTKIKKIGNKSVYGKTLYQKIPLHSDDFYVISQYGDRLDLLAHKYYGDVTLWWYIAKANNLRTMNIPTNIQLRIPGTTKYAQGK